MGGDDLRRQPQHICARSIRHRVFDPLSWGTLSWSVGSLQAELSGLPNGVTACYHGTTRRKEPPIPKRPHPEPTPLAAIVAELVARAERGPPPASEPDAAAPVCRYRPPRCFRHPWQRSFRFPEEGPDGTERKPPP
jgi:hypothetical protein